MTDHLNKNGRINYVAPTESQLADAVRIVNLFAEKWAKPDAEASSVSPTPLRGSARSAELEGLLQ
jgi:hypothetical protein